MTPPIQCHEPATRSPLGVVPIDPPEAVKDAIDRARRAQHSWRETTFADRRRVLKALLEMVIDESDAICEMVVKDAGKTRENALIGEIWTVCEKLRWTIASGEKHLRPERVSSGLMVHKKARLEFRPLGVIGAIIPWNYPFQNIMNPLIPALMAGNAIVLKPSEWVAWSSAQMIDRIRAVLTAQGVDPELVQCVQGHGETAQALITSGIDGVVFIGSVGNGRKVIEASAEPIIPVILELGGKDPFVVCDDADLEQAVHAALAGCFINCGQNCVASERVLLFDGIYDAFEARAAELVGAFRQGTSSLAGAPIDVGAMTTPLQIELVERLVKTAVEQGARVVTGGHRVLSEQGDFFAPTILADVTPQMDIMQEETFGPVMLLCRVSSEGEAIEVANSTSFGLSSSVFSKDHTKARRIAQALEAGMTAINEFGGATYMAQALTFGGIKASGFGRINGREGLRACCNVKAVLDDRFPLHFPNKLFPVGARDYAMTRDVVATLYGATLAQRWRGVKALTRTLMGRR